MGLYMQRTAVPSRYWTFVRPERWPWFDSRASTTATQPRRLNGTELFVDRSALPDDTEGGEFYHADLIGLAVRDENNEMVGNVTAVQNYGGGDILEITLGGSKGVLIPFTQAAVPLVDVAAGFVRIDTAAAGLSDKDDDAGPLADDAPGKSSGGFDRRPRGPKGAGGNR